METSSGGSEQAVSSHREQRRVAQLRRNSLFGVAGLLGPTFIILLAYPVLLGALGGDGFGIFVLVTTALAITALGDIGLSPATTHFVARDLAGHDNAAAATTIATASAACAGIGCLLGVVMWFVSPWLATTFAGPADHASATNAFRVAAFLVPASLLTSVGTAALKGMGKFDASAAILTAMSAGSIVGALIGVLLEPSVLAAVLGFGTGYVLAAIVSGGWFLHSGRQHSFLIYHARPSSERLRTMLRYGSVMTGNSIASLLLYQVQRFVAAGVLGPSSVAVYQLASVIPARIQALIAAGTESFFPFASSSPTRSLLRHAYVRILAAGAVASVTATAILLALRESLYSAWLGASVAADVVPLVPIFGLAYICVTLTAAPFYLANGMGKPGVVTSLHIVGGLLNVLFLAVLLGISRSIGSIAVAFLAATLITFGGYHLIAEFRLWRSYKRATGDPLTGLRL